MIFNPDEIKKKAKKDFEKTWLETSKQMLGKGSFKSSGKKGKEHLLWEYSLRIRKILLDLGFDEVILNPVQPDEEIIKQYGPEAGAILDRVYYTASLPRPDIGLSDKKKELIKKRIKKFNRFGELQEVLKKYKRNEIEGGEDFTEILVNELGIKTSDALYLINSVFPELLNLKPEPSNLSLISHATTSWFPVLSEMGKKEHPIMLFSLVWRFRKEQKEDKTHLRAHINFSMVVLDENFKIDNGKELTEKLFKKLGFNEVRFEPKPNQPAYYAPGTNYEVFVKHPKTGWIEVSEIGMYSPVALANYKIKYPVFNSGPGLGRIVMALENINDIRELYYPYSYKKELSDKEIASGIKINKKPKTQEGKNISKIILKGIIENKDLIGETRKKVYDKKKIYISEPEEGKKLLGPGGLNEIYVYHGDILAVKPGDKKFEEILKNGIRVCSFLEAISNLFAYKIEKGEKGRMTIKYADTLPSINLELGKETENFLKNKKIEIKAPVFVDIEVE